MIFRLFTCLLLIFCSAFSCSNVPKVEAHFELGQIIPDLDSLDSLDFLFLGHPYKRLTKENRLDDRIGDIDFSAYDGLWLGGDLTPYKIHKKKDLIHLDSLLSIRAESTLWAIGNHDYDSTSMPLISDFTSISYPFLWRRGSLGVFVMNSSYGKLECSKWRDQFKKFKEVCENLEGLKCLVVLSHHAIWSDLVPQDEISAINNALVADRILVCEPPQTFIESYYPKLVKLKNQGIQVVLLSGDAGTKSLKNGSWLSDEGIDLLLCGMGNSYYYGNPSIKVKRPPEVQNDQLIQFHYEADTLSWKFEDLNVLSGYVLPE